MWDNQNNRKYVEQNVSHETNIDTTATALKKGFGSTVMSVSK